MFNLPLPTFSPGNLHPILVNFTAALVPVSVASDFFGRILNRESLRSTGWWTLVYATAITPFTALAGWWWKGQVIDMLSAQLILEHQILGISLAVALVALAAWRYSAYRKDAPLPVMYFMLAVAVVFALVIQGAIGGKMLLGS